MSQQQEHALGSTPAWAEQTGEQGVGGYILPNSSLLQDCVWLRGPQVHYKSNKYI